MLAKSVNTADESVASATTIFKQFWTLLIVPSVQNAWNNLASIIDGWGPQRYSNSSGHYIILVYRMQQQPRALCQINNAITRIISFSVNGGRCELTCVRMYVINNAITQLISFSVNGGLANLRNAQNIILVYIRQPLAAAVMSWRLQRHRSALCGTNNSLITRIYPWLGLNAQLKYPLFSHMRT